MSTIHEQLHPDAKMLRLGRFDASDELLLYNVIAFERGRASVEIMLRRATISGRVDIEGEGVRIDKHLADVMDANGDLVQTVSLDKGSFDFLNRKLRPGRWRP